MTAPEHQASADAQRDAEQLRTKHDAGGTIGSAMLRAIQVLRRDRYENEARDLENALLLMNDFVSDQMSEIPEQLREGIEAYITIGRPTGSFLQAVLSNDLADAIARADAASMRGIRSVLDYLRSEQVPPKCWGSAERVRTWLTLSATQRETILRVYRSATE